MVPREPRGPRPDRRLDRVRDPPRPAAVVGDVTRAAATYETPRGHAASSWRRAGRKLRLDVTVPPNTRARVEYPLLGGSARPKAPQEARWIGVQNGRAVFEVGSGDWTFEGSVS
ncbi:alpha-L-rhamnosidase C-terminal domain-containing protein [Actinomadura luteofluorescens]|uniref:alpha-L-rhamnosidase C-terminal domain-containing protein n=1 Tax=Actinomadura luteofluorescens TaxID=46163 RepID=UPI003640955F